LLESLNKLVELLKYVCTNLRFCSWIIRAHSHVA
jgi:hypothetical protein